jgi:dihydropteroate synthase
VEWGRLEDFLRCFLPTSPVPVSLDTSKGEIARLGLDLGVHLLNDVWGLRRDRSLAGLAAEAGAGLILQHNRAKPEYRSLLPEVLSDLEESVNWALEAGLDRSRLIVDPGFGFGKTKEQNLALLRELRSFRSLGLPLLAGVSRKSFTATRAGQEPAERTFGTAAAVALAIEGGADIVRVHDVGSMRDVVRFCDAVLRT